MTQSDSASALEEIAARWAVRADAGTLTPQEEAELDAWTRADSRNAGAFARAMAATAYFDRAAALGAHCETQPEVEERPGLSRRAWLGGGAGAIAASLLAVFGWSRFASRGERIQTAMGSIRRSSLPDGSAVTLNSSAEIEVALQEQVRTVRLLAGEANFDVAKDPRRPFVVHAGDVRVEVVGTSFLVRLLDADGVMVTVREGIVNVQRGAEAALRLTAGDQTVLRAGAQAERTRLLSSDVERLGLWQSGQIDLTDMTLGGAAAEFARYSERHIVIRDPAVAHLKVAGIYSISDPAGFAEAAAQSMDLSITTSPEAIILSSGRSRKNN